MPVCSRLVCAMCSRLKMYQSGYIGGYNVTNRQANGGKDVLPLYLIATML